MIYWALNLLVLIGIVYAAFRYMKSDLPKLVFYSALLIRVLAGLAAAIIFLHIYPANDSLTFYEMSKALLKENTVWGIISGMPERSSATNPRVFFFVKILAVFTYVSGGSYWIAGLYFSLLSFLSSWFFLREFNKLFPDLRTVTTVCFLFIPSIVFWSSGILKDTLAFVAFLFVIGSILKLSKSNRLSVVEIILTIVSLFVLFNLKHYLLITLLLFAGLLFCITLFKKQKGPLRWASLLIPVAFFVATQFVHPYLKIDRIAQTIYENNQTILEKSGDENPVGIVIENAEWSTILSNAPTALFTSLFRPTFFDQTPTIGLLHKLENLLLLSLFIFSLLLLVKEKHSLDWPLLVPSLLCIVMLATLLALTTPNLGTLVRYKNVLMPFLFLISAILPYRHLTSKRIG